MIRRRAHSTTKARNPIDVRRSKRATPTGRRGSLSILCTSAIFVVAAFALISPAANATQDTFDIMARSTSEEEFRGNAAMNDAGDVAYITERGVFASNGRQVTTILADRLNDLASGTPRINASGEVAFSRMSGIFKGDGRRLTAMADSAGEFETFYGAPWINDLGVVAFAAILDDGGSGIFTSEGGTITTIAEQTDELQGLGTPSMNESGQVAFRKVYRNGRQTLVVADSGSLSTIADTRGDVVYELDDRFSFNDKGQAAFWARLQGDLPLIDAILIGDGGPLTRFVDTSGPYWALDGGPALNNRGEMAFIARLDEGFRSGVFTGPDPERDFVIRQGDTIDGATATSFAFGVRINEQGQIAFNAYLAGIGDVIARATPLPDPLPGDTNGDGRISLADLNNVHNHFGDAGPADGTLTGDAYPFDGQVNTDDLNAVLNNFGVTAPAAVPEPAAGVVYALGMGAMLVAGRRLRRRQRGAVTGTACHLPDRPLGLKHEEDTTD